MNGSEWQRILIGACAGFVAAVVVQVIAEWWKDYFLRRMLRKSLVTEIGSIISGLEGLLSFLKSTDTRKREPSQANFPDFLKADCYAASRSVPAFWRLKEAMDIDDCIIW